MSKEIDFEFGRSIGATHYFGREFYKSIDDGWVYRVSYDDGSWKRVSDFFTEHGIIPIPPAEQWTIHNNDKPNKDLTGEQYGKLRRAADAGGLVECKAASGEWHAITFPEWLDDVTYCIKPKSERDEFVVRCIEEGVTTGRKSAIDVIEAMFDAGCRFVENNK